MSAVAEGKLLGGGVGVLQSVEFGQDILPAALTVVLYRDCNRIRHFISLKP